MDQNNIATDGNLKSNRFEQGRGHGCLQPVRHRLGDVYNFMVYKRSGKAEYTVVSFDGFLGVGTEHYRIPWNTLTYDTDKGRYVTDVSRK